MPLFTWQEAEVLVCGSPEIDLDELKRHTMYQGYKEEDPTIQHFWTVMEEWGHKERSKFIQFAWGRQRLPRPGTWGRKMLLQNQHRYDSFFHVVIPLQICLTSLSQLFYELLVFFFLFPLFLFFFFFLSFSFLFFEWQHTVKRKCQWRIHVFFMSSYHLIRRWNSQEKC